MTGKNVIVISNGEVGQALCELAHCIRRMPLSRPYAKVYIGPTTCLTIWLGKFTLVGLSRPSAFDLTRTAMHRLPAVRQKTTLTGARLFGELSRTLTNQLFTELLEGAQDTLISGFDTAKSTQRNLDSSLPYCRFEAS